MTNSFKLILVSVFISILATPSYSKSENINKVRQYKIGISLALSGDASTWGQDMKNTILLAKEEFLKEGFELIFEDDKCEPKTAVAIANKFITVDKVDAVIGYTCSGPLLAAAPLYEKAKIPVVSSSASAAKISEAGQYIFRTFPSDAFAAKELYNYISGQHKTLGIISTETEYSQEFANQFKLSNQDDKIKIIYENVLLDEHDLKPLLLKLKTKKIDSLFINSQSDKEFLRTLKQIKQLNISPPIYSAYWGSSSWFVKEAGALGDGVISVDAATEDKVLNLDGKTLLKKFRDKYGEPNYTAVLVAVNWEAIRAITEALTKSNNPKEYLENTNFSGVFGNWKFDKNGDILGIPFSIKKTVGGKVEEL